MSAVWLMVRKDLLRKLRSPLGVLAALAFPLVFSGLLALTFGSGGEPSIPKVQLLIEDRDQSMLSGFLTSAAGSEQMAEYFEVRQVGEEGSRLIEQDEASALFRIPEGFGDDLLNGRPVTFELVRNPAQDILPEIAEQSLTVFTDVLSAGAHVLREPLSRFAELAESEEGPSLEQVLAMSEQFYGIVQNSETLLFPPVITLETGRLGDDEETSSGGASSGLIFLLVLPGISVWALFLTGDIAMRDIMTERVEGTLTRQLAGPIAEWQLVLGKALFTGCLAGISLLILSAIGWAVSPIGVDLPGFALLSAGLILAVTGFASVVYGSAGSERQGAVISSVLLLVFAFLGGSFIQIDSLPSAVRGVAPYTPFYWGTTGYKALIHDAGTLADILPNAGILSGLGLVLLLVGSNLLGRRMRQGVTA